MGPFFPLFQFFQTRYRPSTLFSAPLRCDLITPEEGSAGEARKPAPALPVPPKHFFPGGEEPQDLISQRLSLTTPKVHDTSFLPSPPSRFHYSPHLYLPYPPTSHHAAQMALALVPPTLPRTLPPLFPFLLSAFSPYSSPLSITLPFRSHSQQVQKQETSLPCTKSPPLPPRDC